MNLRTIAFALFSALAVAGCGDGADTSSDAASPAVGEKAAPQAAALASSVVPDRYIVVFHSGVPDPAAAAASVMRGSGGSVHFVYTRALRGFAATIPAAAIDGILNNPLVDYVEPDQTVTAVSQTQSNATWGIDRVDQRDLPLDSLYHYTPTGAGVTAFVVDTGIRATHHEFWNAYTDATSRVDPGAGFTAFSDAYGTGDCHGHGTHVSGTIGGLTFGVAKAVRLVPVRVLGCNGSGSWSGVIAGLDFVAKSAARPAVANMSLGGGASSAVDTAVQNTVNAGVTVVVAAGNSNADACGSSPARAPSAVTVGATDSSDARAYYSNYGSCLDLFAPGSGITSSTYNSDTSYGAKSGTSMASPHVAGAAALLAQGATLTPAQIAAQLVSNASQDRVGGAGSGSPNLLLYTNPGGDPPPPPPETQTVWVKQLSGDSAPSGRSGWKATVTITVTESGGTVAGATVSGGFTAGGSAVSCVTGSAGSCSISTGTLSNRKVSSTTFTVSGISGSGLQYDGQLNSATSITIARP